MSKTMPDFSNNDEDFDHDEDFESNLQLNQPAKDEEFALDDDEDEDEDEDDQIKKLKEAAREINAEADRLRELQSALKKAVPTNGSNGRNSDDDRSTPQPSIPGLGVSVDSTTSTQGSPSVSHDDHHHHHRHEEQSWDPEDADARSIFAKNVDYSSEAGEINTFFSSCGAIERLTILTDKMTGRPKGCAYVQFKSKEAVESALALDGSTFKGRTLSISKKHRTLPPHKLYRRRRRRRRRFNPYYSYGYQPYYPRRRRRSWAPY